MNVDLSKSVTRYTATVVIRGNDKLIFYADVDHNNLPVLKESKTVLWSRFECISNNW